MYVSCFAMTKFDAMQCICGSRVVEKDLAATGTCVGTAETKEETIVSALLVQLTSI